jgi:transposase
MGWMETCAVDERMRFVMAVEQRDEAFAMVCRRFGVSRKTGYKWLARYRDGGVEGLRDRSRAPLHHPQAITEAIAERCLAMRRAHPTWGPVKVRETLERRFPRTAWPAVSTIGALLDREGLTVKRRLRRRSPPSSAPFAQCGAANDVWCIDFKGWFVTGDGGRCEPLTLCDAHSRYLLRCQALARLDTEHVWPVLDTAFREFGLPHRLRSDNGAPFASCGAGGLSRLSVKVIKAGVVPPARRCAACANSWRACAASSISTMKNVRIRRSATTLRPRIMSPHRGASTASCASRATAPTTKSGTCATTARSGGTAKPSTSTKPWSASPSVSSKAMTATGTSATARSRSASSLTVATACANPNAAPVDLWTTRRRVAHRVHR